MAVQGRTAKEEWRAREGLSAGGSVLTPIGPAAFSPLYGMPSDRFGITWIPSVTAAGGG